MRIFFAVPAYRGIQCEPFLDSLEATVQLCIDKGHETQLSVVTGCPYIQTARNDLVRQADEWNADLLFFLDDDIGWAPIDALRLIEMDDDIVAGMYRLRCEDINYPAVLVTDDDGHAYARTADGCVWARRVPTGFLRIKMSVLRAMMDQYPELRYTDDYGKESRILYDLFPQGIKNGRWIGEDFAFCDLWTAMGGEIWIYPNITITHYDGPKSYVGNFYDYMMSWPTEDQE